MSGERISIYVKKYNRRWMKTLQQYVKDVYKGEMDFSEFIVMVLKNHINDLDPGDIKVFEAAAEKIMIEQNPEALRYIKNLRKDKL